MKGIKGLRIGLVGAAAIALALIGGMLLAGTALGAAHGTADVSDGSAAPGEEGSGDVSALGVGGEGLGAWTIDISYDTGVITAVDCSAEQGGVCNAEFGDGVVRVTGASAGGLDGDTVLGSITFECGADEGSSDLTISINVFADATIGDPQDLNPSISDGTFDCEEEDDGAAGDDVVEPPKVGTGPMSDSGSSLGWLVALLAVAGVAGLAASLGALRLRTR